MRRSAMVSCTSSGNSQIAANASCNASVMVAIVPCVLRAEGDEWHFEKAARRNMA
jgi:hypothetical protein